MKKFDQILNCRAKTLKFRGAVNLPVCRRLLFPLLHAEKGPFPRATKEIGDVCTQATVNRSLITG